MATARRTFRRIRPSICPSARHFGEKLTVSANAVNIANTRYLLDTSNTFGGTHYINPRQIYGEVRYRFHF